MTFPNKKLHKLIIARAIKMNKARFAAFTPASPSGISVATRRTLSMSPLRLSSLC
jgi:hypothetical protein